MVYHLPHTPHNPVKMLKPLLTFIAREIWCECNVSIFQHVATPHVTIIAKIKEWQLHRQKRGLSTLGGSLFREKLPKTLFLWVPIYLEAMYLSFAPALSVYTRGKTFAFFSKKKILIRIIYSIYKRNQNVICNMQCPNFERCMDARF